MADVLDTTEIVTEGQVQNESETETSLVQNIEETVEEVDDDGEESDSQAVTTDILQQAFVEASGGTISHIDEEPDLCSPENSEKQLELDKTDAVNLDSDNVGAVLVGGHEVPTLPHRVISTQSSLTQSQNTILASNGATGISDDVSIPLGSKSNPIRIIQQGNTYKSTQKLSQEQIQQIVQVLQRQNLASKTVDGGPTAVYNPETNTRIVYRVVQPHDKANKSVVAEDGSMSTATLTARDYHRTKYGSLVPKRGRGRPK